VFFGIDEQADMKKNIKINDFVKILFIIFSKKKFVKLKININYQNTYDISK
jgi:hypothetical protein